MAAQAHEPYLIFAHLQKDEQQVWIKMAFFVTAPFAEKGVPPKSGIERFALGEQIADALYQVIHVVIAGLLQSLP